MAPTRSTRGVMVAARVAPTEREEIVRVAMSNDRTPSREIRRAIRFYLANREEADRFLREVREGMGGREQHERT